MMGGKFLFTEEVDICISGAIFEVKLNNNSIVNNTIIRVQKGDILNFGKTKIKSFVICILYNNVDFECRHDSKFDFLNFEFGEKTFNDIFIVDFIKLYIMLMNLNYIFIIKFDNEHHKI